MVLSYRLYNVFFAFYVCDRGIRVEVSKTLIVPHGYNDAYGVRVVDAVGTLGASRTSARSS